MKYEYQDIIIKELLKQKVDKIDKQTLKNAIADDIIFRYFLIKTPFKLATAK